MLHIPFKIDLNLHRFPLLTIFICIAGIGFMLGLFFFSRCRTEIRQEIARH